MTDVLYDRSNDRRLPRDYAGDVLLWDIDKTYLDTHFSSWRGLLAIPFDMALDKRAVPGAVPLLQALRRGPGERSALVPLYFVSGSPRELRPIIERKMTLDGVEFDGITFKDQWGLAKRRRFSAIKRQIAYKLTALMLYRAELPDGARWLMFGDDVESDAEVFALFGEVCAGLRGESLDTRLAGLGVEAGDRAIILELSSHVPVTADPVERIFIRLASGRPPGQRGGDAPAVSRGPRVVECATFAEAARELAAMGRIRSEDVLRIEREVNARAGER